MGNIETKKWLSVQENVGILRTLDEAFKEAGNREIVFLCVGNSKIWYDSFGPMFGSVMMMLDVKKYIYGNTRYNIVASNLKEYIDLIYKFHISPYIVVVDSALSFEHEGLVVKKGKTTCAALSKNPIAVGDLSIIFSLYKSSLDNYEKREDMTSALKKIARFVLFALETKNAK